MSKNYNLIDESTGTFAGWLTQSNDLFGDMTNIIVTVSTTAGLANLTNNSTTVGNGHIQGIFSSDVMVVNTAIHGGDATTGFNTKATLYVTSNVTIGTSGTPENLLVWGDSTLKDDVTIGTATTDALLIESNTNINGKVYFHANAHFDDADRLMIGSADDLQIYHNATDSYIDNNTGHLYIRQSANVGFGDIIVQAIDDVDALNDVIKVYGDIAAPYAGLFYDNSEKLTTISSGISVTGSATLSALTDNRITFAGTAGILEDSADLTFDGTTLTVGGADASVFTVTTAGVGNFDGALTVDGLASLDGGIDVNGAAFSVSSAGAIDTSATLTVDGLSSLDGGIDVNAANFTVAATGAINTASTLTVDGLASLDGGIDVNAANFTVAATGAIDTASTLTVDGLSSLDGGIDVDSAFTVADTTGNVSTSGTLRVTNVTDSSSTSTGAAAISGGLGIAKKLFVGTTSSLAGTTTIGGGYGSTGTTITDAGNISTNGTLTVDGTSTLGVINASGLASLDGGIDVDGKFTVADTTGNVATTGTLGVTGTSTLGVINASGLASLDGGIDVDGAFTVADTTGNVATTGTLQAGETTLSSATVSDLTSGRVVLAGTSGALQDSGNLTFNGSTLAVTGAATISTTFNVGGGYGSTGFSVATNGNTSTNGTLTVDGTSTLGVINASGLASLDGGIDVDGAFTVADTTGNIASSGTLRITNATGSSTSTSGAAVITGGLGVGGNLNVGGVATVNSFSSTNNASVGGNLTVQGALIATGSSSMTVNTATMTTLSVIGNTDLGDATSDTLTITARIDSDIVPSTDSTRDLGTNALRFAEAYVDNAFITANVNIQNAGHLKFYDSDNSNFVAFKSAGALTANVTWTLPNADASTSGYSLQSNGSGVLSWGPAGATTTADESTNAEEYLYFSDITSGTVTAVHHDTGLRYNPSLGRITTASANVVTLSLNGTAVTATATELNYVDGVTSAIQTQLNSKLASASYTASDVLTKLKTVDGSGSGLDADLLDGQQGSSYLRSDFADTKTSGDLTFSDSVAANFGSGADVEMYHTGNHMYMDINTGTLLLRDGTNSNATALSFTPTTASLVLTNYDETGEGPVLSLRHDSVSPAAGDQVGQIFFQGDDSGGTNTDYAYIDARIVNTTNTSEAGSLLIYAKQAGANSVHFSAISGVTTLYHNGNAKIATTSTGIDVTGTAEMDTLSIGGTAVTSTPAELNVLDGYTGSVTELNYLDTLHATGVTSTEFDYLDGVTSNIQTQLNGKQATITGGATTIVSSNLTASRALISNSSGKVDVSAVTSTELGYLDGVTSNIQTQLNAKAPLASPALTGTATAVNLTVSGDLTVNGTTTTLNTTNIVVSDNIIELNNGVTSNANDSGIIIERGTTGANAFMGWDESADKFIVGTTTATGSSTGNLTITAGTLVASTFEGNLSGNVTGNVTGSSGSCTGNAATATTLQTARTINGVSFNGSANITVEPYIEDDNTTNAAKYVIFTDNSTAGFKRLNEDSSFTYNPYTNTVSATTFNGALSGNAATVTNGVYTTGNQTIGGTKTFSSTISGSIDGNAATATTATTATGATNININATTSTDTTTYPVLVGAASTGNQIPFIDNSDLSYNASTGTLSATVFSGSGASLTALNADNISTGTLARDRIENDAIDGTKIANDSINSEHYVANSIDAEHLNVSGNGTTSQFLRSDGDGSFTWATPTDTNTTYSAGTGMSLIGTTFSIGQAVATTSSVQFGSFGVGTPASGTTGEIRATNNITAYYSDRRLKDDITPINNALDKIAQISGVTYRSNDIAKEHGYTSDKLQYGVIAQEVEAIMPEIVVPAPFDIEKNEETGEEYSKTGENYKTVQYEKIIPLLIEAIKELKAEIEELKKR